MRFLYTRVLYAFVFLSSCICFSTVHGQIGTIQLGSGAATTSLVPLKYNFNFNYSQTIYTAAEMLAAGAQAGPITKIRYKATAAVSTEKWRAWVVYMANSTKVGFVDNSDFIDVTTLTQVFSGDLVNNTTANTWMEIVLNQPFIWDGTSNVVIAVDENTPGFGGDPKFSSYVLATATGSKAIYAYRDGTVDILPTDPNAVATATLNKGVTNTVSQIQFEGTLASCLPITNLGVTAITSSTANLSWTANGAATTWDVEWGPVGFTPGTGNQIGSLVATTATAQITGLSQLTNYEVYVRANCGAGDYSYWSVPVAFVTQETPNTVPYYDNFDASTWSTENTETAVNKWFIGSAAGNPAKGLYVSNDNGVSAQYTTTSATSYSRVKKLISLPATVTSPLKIRYNWIGIGEGGSDRIRVWLVPATSAVVAVGTDISTTNTPGAVSVGLTNHSGTVGGTWQTVSFNVPVALLGTNVYVFIEWKNDGSVGNNTTAQAIDNFAVYSLEASPAISQEAGIPTCMDGSDLTIVSVPNTPNVAYWQVSETGTSVDNNANTPWTVFENGTYYVRTLNSFTNEWSTATSIVVNNFDVAVAPPAPIAAANPACLPGTEIVVVGTPPADVEYFWQGTLATNSNIDLPASTPYFVNETGTYYVKAKNNVSGCWSEAVGLAVAVDEMIPSTPTVNPSVMEVCEGSTSVILQGTALSGVPTTIAGDLVPNSGCTFGIMYDITVANAPILVSGFDIIPDVSGAQNVEVYVKDGTYVGSETAQAAWTLVGTYPITGADNVSQFLDIADFTVAAQATKGIYIKFNGKYDDANQTFTNADLTITPGRGHCTAWSPGTSPRVFAGKIHYQVLLGNVATWYDAPVGGNIIGNTEDLEAIGTPVLPVAIEGVYNFYLESSMGACNSVERAVATINVVKVLVELTGVDATCNNGNNGTFEVESISCGTEPFMYSVNGGAFSATIPTDLEAGTYTVVIQDANNNESVENTIVIGSAEGPSDVVEVSIANNSATIQWTANGSETEWTIEYGAPGFTPGTGTAIGTVTATANPFTITGLTGDTEYDVYVAANCGLNTTPGTWSAIEIWTLCNAVEIPFIETFENDSETLSCWRVDDVEGDGNWTIATGAGNGTITTAYEGTQNARFTGGSDDEARLISPVFNVTGQDSVAVVFAIGQQYWLGDINSNTLSARFDMGTTWNEVRSYTEAINTWKVDTVFIPVNGTELELSFLAVDDAGYNNVVDAVKVFPCSIEPSADNAVSVCRSEGTIDVSTVLTPVTGGGRWVFNQVPGLMTGSVLNIALLAEGAYEVYYIVATPCAVDTTVATITISSPSRAGVDGTLTVCKNQQIDLLSGLSGTVDFGGTWYAPNGTAMEDSYFMTGTLGGQQVYTYIVSNGNCDADTSTVLVNITACNYLGAEDALALEKVTVSPNPSNGQFQIGGIPNADYAYEVLDLNGRVIKTSEKIKASVTNVDLTTVENGVYIIRINGDSNEKMIRVIKQ